MGLSIEMVMLWILILNWKDLSPISNLSPILGLYGLVYLRSRYKPRLDLYKAVDIKVYSCKFGSLN